MNKEEVKEILMILKINYPNIINESNIAQMLDTWTTELSQYDRNDVRDRIKDLLSKQEYQMKPPTLYHIIATLKKKNEKINWEEMVYFCDNCKRPFNSYDEMMKHRARENSIRYIERETKKWYNKELTDTEKAKLYQMEEKTFQEGYNRLLKHIQENTTDEEEKIRIEYIFNPPNEIEALEFINRSRQ